jgi:hypothetical protein
LLGLLDRLYHVFDLVRFRVTTELTRNGHAALGLWMLLVAMAAFAAEVLEAGRFEVCNEFAELGRHCGLHPQLPQ